jgi:hypothetical protein
LGGSACVPYYIYVFIFGVFGELGIVGFGEGGVGGSEW